VGLDHAAVADAVQEAHAVALQASGGASANYIPILAKVPTQLCGVCAVTPDGEVFEAGDTRFDFAIESISKVFTLALAIEQCGAEVVREKIVHGLPACHLTRFWHSSSTVPSRSPPWSTRVRSQP
jgi:glutaminase